MKIPFIFIVALAFPALVRGQSPASSPALHWTFDSEETNAITDRVSGQRAELKGNVSFASGVQGKCLILDGLTTFGLLAAGHQPKLDHAFTLDAWIALGAYPLARAPILDLHDTNNYGFSFGFDAHGRLELGLRAGEQWQVLTSSNTLPIRQWHRVAGSFDPGLGMSLYVDGHQISHRKVEGAFHPAAGLDLLMGRSRAKEKPEGPVRADSTGVVFDFIDGALDEVKIASLALSPEEIAHDFGTAKASSEVPLPPRVLPSGPPGMGPFGAFYTHLKFYPQWDAPWRVSEYPDVVVRFDHAPVRFVFWRGTSYIPNWVTENGIWYNNEFNETWAGVLGCGEPMSDKQCRFSNVRVIESNEARAVVHWRYALVDVFYTHARADPLTGWGDWSDEIYTIYPDGTSVRDITLHSTHPEEPHEWQESIVVMGPGFSPENSIEPAGVTLVDAAGESATYSWKDSTPAAKPGKPAHPCIQLINTKSRFKPFAILRPQDKTDFDVYAGEIRRDVTMYPWWNHWPAATYPSDGRYAMAADRTSHSSLTHLFWEPYSTGNQWMRKIMLAGMTDQPAASLLGMMRSWSAPASLKITGGEFKSEGYDQAQKAYVLTRKPGGDASALKMEIAASSESPILNPAFVIKNWGDSGASVTIDGKEIPRGPAFRFGHRQSMEGADLIVWLKTEQRAPVHIIMQPE